SFLSYFQLSIETQLWIDFLGLILPLGIGIVFSLQNRQKSNLIDLSMPDGLPLPFWLIAVFVALFIFIRFYRLTTVPFWPVSDESVFSTLAFDLTRKWDWTLLRTDGQMEPLLLWLLSFWFKIMDPSILSLRLFTVFFSIASSLAAYFTARQFLNKSLSFLLVCLFSFSFWEIGLSRQCTPNDLIPFFELLSFFFLGLYWRAQKNTSRWFWILVLSLCAAIGFYVYINWTVVWVFILVCLLMIGIEREKLKVAAFVLITAELTLPLVFARLSPHSMGYAKHFLENFSVFSSLAQYSRGLFWDGSSSNPLGPAWGGYFDSVSGALILTGGLYALRKLFSKTLLILGLGIGLTLLPGILTNTLELQRITPALPFFMVLAVLGMKSLWKNSVKPLRIAVLSVILLLITTLNTYQLFGPYNDIRQVLPGRHWRSTLYFSAYRILENLSAQSGPVYIFNEWNGDYFDKTLALACYPFNAAQNTALISKNPTWVAFLTDADYESFLKKEFPYLQSRSLDDSISSNDSSHPLRLFLIPVSDIPQETLTNWLSADEECRQIALSILNKNASIPWSFFEKNYSRLAVQYEKNPFLSSVLWEKAASFPLIDGNCQMASLDFQQAIKNGYRAPHLIHNLKLAVFLSHSPSPKIKKTK
ncbi:MAG TPA: glycosyltransferase family 39 protein, partial [bacterium]|nr:glycosyltransferase family 39 protein [bacterium]